MTDYLDRIKNFTVDTLPDLDEVVLGALTYLSTKPIPTIDIHRHSRPLIVGSVNALRTGQIMFHHTDAIFAEEGAWEETLRTHPAIDALYIISASGGKHAGEIAAAANTLSIPVYLITSNADAPARPHLNPENVFVFPHIREPYTYNTSTYLAMIAGASQEPLDETLHFIETVLAPHLNEIDFSKYQSYVLITPTEYPHHRGMFETKFDELFDSKIPGRAFSVEEMKHAKTVIPVDNECFISFGKEQSTYGTEASRITIPLPPVCDPASFLAIGYFVIGKIQKRNPPYFKENIVRYTEEASKLFGQTILPIVE